MTIMTLVSVAAVLLVLLSTPSPDPGPLPVDDLTRFERAVAGPVELEVVRDRAQLVSGRPTTYTIVVRNRGEQPEPVTVRVSVPPDLADVAPDPAGVLGSGFVDWTVTVDPGTPAELRLTGAYARPGAEWGRTTARVTLTACVLDAGGEQPLTCATDVAQVQGRGWLYTRWWWLAAVVIVAGAVAVLGWHRRRQSRTTVG